MGWTYNTADPNAPTMGPTITGVAAALTAISLLTVCLRMYVRFSLIKAPGVDDWIIMTTWVSSLMQQDWTLAGTCNENATLTTTDCRCWFCSRYHHS